MESILVIPAKAGIHHSLVLIRFPQSLGMTDKTIFFLIIIICFTIKNII